MFTVLSYYYYYYRRRECNHQSKCSSTSYETTTKDSARADARAPGVSTDYTLCH